MLVTRSIFGSSEGCKKYNFVKIRVWTMFLSTHSTRTERICIYLWVDILLWAFDFDWSWTFYPSTLPTQLFSALRVREKFNAGKKNLGESSCSASPPCHVKTLDASTVWKDAQKELCLKIVFSRYTVVQYTALLLTLLVPYTLFPILLLSLQLPLPNNFSSYLNKFQSFSSKITVVKTVFFYR